MAATQEQDIATGGSGPLRTATGTRRGHDHCHYQAAHHEGGRRVRCGHPDTLAAAGTGCYRPGRSDGRAAMEARNLEVGLVPRDLQRSLEFYRDVIGLEFDSVIDLGEGRALHMFRVGDGVLKLWESTDVPAEVPAAEWEQLTGIRWVTFDVDEIDEAVARCVAAGVPVGMPVTEIRPGLRVANVSDPDGNRVELLDRAG
jgi:lactoylglutathione lyase